MRICVIADGFPSEGRNEFVFVQQLCIELTRQGHKIYVIAPQSYTKRVLRHLPKLPFKREEKVESGTITIFSPQFISLGNKGKRFKFIRESRKKAILKALDVISGCIDIIYCHFWHNGYPAFNYAQKHNIPLFVASGEAQIEQQAKTADEIDFTKYVKGVICVSSKNLNESKNLGLITNAPSAIIPNAIDDKVFHKLDKTECRNELGFSTDDFIVSFVGGFIERKGPDRVSEAIKQLQDSNIKSIFIGGNRDGKNLVPDCDGILHCGPLSHEKIPLYLNASDIFVLPTLHEGCCNAIIEAMACGLPIISSDREFNYDILDETNSILVDPLNIEEIANAINRIKSNHELQKKLSSGSLKKAENLKLEKRAERIIQFINDQI